MSFPDSSCLFFDLIPFFLSSLLVKGFLMGARCVVGSTPVGLGGLAFSQGYWRFFYAIA